LDWDGGFEIEAGDNLEQPEAHQDTHRVQLTDGDIANHERDEGAEVSKGPGKFT
jgi:hypothetical protein